MKPSSDVELLNIVKATGEIYSRQVSPVAAQMFLTDLDKFDSEQIKTALRKCRQELRTFPTIADVVARIDDGRPGVEEAWAMLPKYESDSVVWTDEMANAYGLVRSLIDSDMIAARMAFKEAYNRNVSEARAIGRPANWSPSLGHDQNGREAVLLEAVERGRLGYEQAQSLLPDMSHTVNQKLLQIIASATKKLPSSEVQS